MCDLFADLSGVDGEGDIVAGGDPGFFYIDGGDLEDWQDYALYVDECQQSGLSA